VHEEVKQFMDRKRWTLALHLTIIAVGVACQRRAEEREYATIKSRWPYCETHDFINLLLERPGIGKSVESVATEPAV